MGERDVNKLKLDKLQNTTVIIIPQEGRPRTNEILDGDKHRMTCRENILQQCK